MDSNKASLSFPCRIFFVGKGLPGEKGNRKNPEQNAVQAGISNVFEQAGCGTAPVRSLLGEGGVSEANMMQYLGIVEQRTNEILQVSPRRCESVTGQPCIALLSL